MKYQPLNATIAAFIIPLLATLLTTFPPTSAFAQDWPAGLPHSAAKPIAPVIPGGERGPGVPNFTVAKGYRVDVAAEPATQTRFLEFDDFGTLYVSAPSFGTITSFRKQSDGKYAQVAVVVTGKRRVQGMSFHGGYLWFASTGGIYKGKPRPDGSALDGITTIIPEGKLPHDGGHWYRSILVDDSGFYTSIGDSGNISDHTKTDREKVWRYSLDASSRTLFCGGIRNTEKLLFRPGTTEVWGCDHGSDMFGYTYGDRPGHQPITDNIPGDEVNHYQQGKFYGHPFIVDNNLIRPEYAQKPDIQQIKARSIPPEYMLPAHYADCGWTFLTHDSPIGKRGDMIITSHGSWNSSAKVGYCVSILPFTSDGHPKQAVKLVNCLDPAKAGEYLGRPTDIVEEPGTNALLFSVDEPHPGHVYRLTFVGNH